MMDKSAAWEAGVIAGMEKDAGKVRQGLSALRAAVNKKGADVIGSMGQKSKGRLGQALDTVAHGGRQQAAKSKRVVREEANLAKRKAKAKNVTDTLDEAVGKKVQKTKNPGQRMKMRDELAETKGRVEKSIVDPKAHAKDKARRQAVKKQEAPAKKPEGLSTSRKVGIGVGVLGGVGITGAAATRPQQQNVPHGGMA